MRRIFGLRSLRKIRCLAAEPLEQRVLLDAHLGAAFSQFESVQEVKSLLIEQAVQRWQYQFGQTTWQWGDWGLMPWMRTTLECAACDGVVPPGATPMSDATSDHSDTNTQVAGVDEGDQIETDGDYVYLLSNNQLTIFDVRTPDHPRVASRVPLDHNGYASELYLDGERLMVLSTEWEYFVEPWRAGPVTGAPMMDVAVLDAAFAPQPSRQRVVATVWDVSNRDEPRTVHRTEVDGYLSNSRAIDGKAYLVIGEYLDFPAPEMHPLEGSPQTVDPRAEDPGSGTKFVGTADSIVNWWPEKPTHVYETEVEYRAHIEPIILDVLPGFSGFGPNGDEVTSGYLTEPTEIYRPESPDLSEFVSVVTIDMHDDVPGPHQATSLMASSGHEIYMATDSLYVFQPKWDVTDQTRILKFAVNPEDGSVTPAAAGEVPGRMLNQFSADQYQRYLRVATTSGWGNESKNRVFVLDQQEGQLEVVGRINNLAPGENIYSVRFLGERAYVVTFLRVDPLFALDLSDPANPEIEGELKIPGFSEYLHPVDQNHLLGIGRNADERTGRVGELQVSLFDVSDATNPQVVDRFSFDEFWGTWSSGESDHHAVGYYPSYQTLALPVSGYTGPRWWEAQDNDGTAEPQQVNALYVFQIDVNSGIQLVGTVEHPSQVQRSVRVGQSLISVSWDTLKINAIQEPAKLIGQVHYLLPVTPGVIVDPPQARDIDVLFQEAASGSNAPPYDLDGNGLVNEDDVEFVVRAVLQTKFGDADLDGHVGFSDFVSLADHYDQAGGWADGDFDGDGLVGFSDFTLLAKYFGT